MRKVGRRLTVKASPVTASSPPESLTAYRFGQEHAGRSRFEWVVGDGVLTIKWDAFVYKIIYRIYRKRRVLKCSTGS